MDPPVDDGEEGPTTVCLVPKARLRRRNQDLFCTYVVMGFDHSLPALPGHLLLFYSRYLFSFFSSLGQSSLLKKKTSVPPRSIRYSTGTSSRLQRYKTMMMTMMMMMTMTKRNRGAVSSLPPSCPVCPPDYRLVPHTARVEACSCCRAGFPIWKGGTNTCLMYLRYLHLSTLLLLL